MPALNTAAIQTAIRNVIDGTFTGVRDITAGTYSAGQPAEVKGLMIVTPTYDVEITDSADHGASDISNSSSRAIVTLGIVITVGYVLPPVVLTADRYVVQATIVNNADLLVQALTMPGNLDDDGAGTPVPTSIVSGMLFGPGGAGRPSIAHTRDWPALTATTTINASAVVVVTQPVS